MRLKLGGRLAVLMLCLGTTAAANAQNANDEWPPLRRPVQEVGFVNESNPVSTFWQDEAPPVPAPLSGLELEDPIDEIAPYVHPVGTLPYHYPPTQHLGHLGDGYYPYAPVAYNACCAYESGCGDPSEYKLKVWTVCDLGHELWNEVLFGVIDPTCRMDPDCSQGPPTCCRKHGIGLLDLFPRHKQELLARRAQACAGCATSDGIYPNANPPGCHSCQGAYGYTAQPYYAAQQSTYKTQQRVTRISAGREEERTARQVFTVPRPTINR